MNTKHTPGRWKVEGTDEWGTDPDFLIIASEHQGTCKIALVSTSSSTYAEANAQLIAAAPELLEACGLLMAEIDNLVKDGTLTPENVHAHPSIEQARKAIAKATQ